jgi:acetylornithine aminotransferase
VPIGACLAAGPAAGVFGPGNHGTTFGGGPLAMRAGLETLKIIEAEGLMANAVEQGERIRAGLTARIGALAGVREIRGRGLMIGVELDRPCGELVKGALDAGLLINVTRDNVIRLLPPLVITRADADLVVERLAPLVAAFLAAPAKAA